MDELGELDLTDEAVIEAYMEGYIGRVEAEVFDILARIDDEDTETAIN